MSVDQWRTVLRKLVRVGVPHIIFTGGEPTLFDGLAALIRETNRLGMVAGLNTNGRLLGHGTMACDLKRAGLAHVQITLESDRSEVHDAMTAPGAFDETVGGIDRCLAAGLHTITNTTLTRRNAARAVDLLGFLHARGVQCCAMNAMIHAGRGRAHPDTLVVSELPPVLAAVRDRSLELGMRMLWYTPTRYCELSPMELELGAKRCNAAEYSICIEPDGDVLPCHSVTDLRLMAESSLPFQQAAPTFNCASRSASSGNNPLSAVVLPAGNLLRDSWPDIWHSPLFRSLRGRVAIRGHALKSRGPLLGQNWLGAGTSPRPTPGTMSIRIASISDLPTVPAINSKSIPWDPRTSATARLKKMFNGFAASSRTTTLPHQPLVL